MKLNAEKAEHWASANGGKRRRGGSPSGLNAAPRRERRAHPSAADGAGAARSLLAHEKAPKARVPDVKWTRVPRQAPLPAAPLERWDADTGEFVGQGRPAGGHPPGHPRRRAVRRAWAPFLEALGALAIPDPVGCPLLRAGQAARRDARRRRRQGKGQEGESGARRRVVVVGGMLVVGGGGAPRRSW